MGLLACHSRVPFRYGNASANERDLNHMSWESLYSDPPAVVLMYLMKKS